MSPAQVTGAVILFLLLACGASSPPPRDLVIVDLAHGMVGRFRPDQAFGAVVDGLPAGRIQEVYSPGNVIALKQAGLGPIAYNLRTELGIEAWHWTEEGVWSDAKHQQGYWVGSDHPSRPVMTGWGYFLPRRGDSTDQANDDGWSRLDDGDPKSFWKSNPYLDQAYTRIPPRPQWVVVSFPDPQPVSVVHLNWAAPFALRYEVQHWTGIDPYDRAGHWITFPTGHVTAGAGGDVRLILSPIPVPVQFVRILLQKSSHTAPPGSQDARDSMGYALNEISLGVAGRGGRFVDAVRHARSGSEQTNIYVSSTDPWHRASDRDADTEQPGFDRLFLGHITNGLPLLLTVGALYDTPENSAAQLRFLKARGYPVHEVEIGLEPDGQNISPEDFDALFIQSARALHAVDPTLALGGPGLQQAVSDTWLDDDIDHSWTRRFLSGLKALGHWPDLSLFTFEHYPYDAACGGMETKLIAENRSLDDSAARLRDDGVPFGFPKAIIEFGLSAFSGQAAVEMPGALFNADMTAQFLTLGGRSAYMLGYGPERLFTPETACAGYGELMLFGQAANGKATWPTPAYWGARMLTGDWAQPGDSEHFLYATRTEAPSAGPAWIVSYSVRRPDGRLAVLMINRDPLHEHTIRLMARRIVGAAPTDIPGPLDIVQYGPENYQWKADGAAGRPIRNEPPRRFTQADGKVRLPPFSMTVARTSAAIGP